MYLVRLLIVGETGVGKTSLLVRFNEDNFISDQKTTIGVDYKAKEVQIDEETVKLQVNYSSNLILCLMYCLDLGHCGTGKVSINDIGVLQ